MDAANTPRLLQHMLAAAERENGKKVLIALASERRAA